MDALVPLLIGLFLILLIFIRVDIAFAIGIAAFTWLIVGDQSLTVGVRRVFGGMDEFVLLAIPFFLLAGELMNNAEITERLIRFANVTIGRLKGGLAQANVVASMLFAGITGAAIADVAALGSIFIPSMEQEGYDVDFSAAVTAASSIVGPIIPPSIILVIYGAVTNTSVGGLFAAAVLPGFLLGVMLLIATVFISYRLDLPRYEADVELSEYPKLAFDSLLALTMPAIILFGIVFGIFTPTEAAAVACAYAVVLGVGYRTLSLADMHDSLRISLERTAQLYVIIGFAGVLTWLLAFNQVPQIIAGGIESLGLGPVGFMFTVALILLFVGTWLETSAATIILAPTLADMAMLLGIHQFQFGIVLVITLSFGLITPPLGVCLFAAASVSNADVWPIAKQIVPFFVVDLIALVLLILFPSLTLYVPRLFGLI